MLPSSAIARGTLTGRVEVFEHQVGELVWRVRI